ncbi:MAG: hypothetical protein JJ992_03090, partial [Planctomycetes bacterium]|nr:hypothetical protein [Planctomycetota bacterium]
MLERHLMRELDAVAHRVRRWRLSLVLAANWLALAVLGVFLLWATGRQYPVPPWVVPGLIIATIASSVFIWLAVRRSERDYCRLARKIEARYPELDSALLAAIEQRPRLELGRLGFLQERVVREAIMHCRTRPWTDVVSAGQFTFARMTNFAALILLVVVLSTLTVRAGSEQKSVENPTDDPKTIDVGRYLATIEPGDTEIERGTSLLVVARFGHLVPEQGVLEVRHEVPADGSATASEPFEQAIVMSRSLDDPLLVGRVAEVTRDLTYHVEFAGERSSDFRVKVFDYPKLQRLDVRLAFPRYTHLSELVVEGARRRLRPVLM